MIKIYSIFIYIRYNGRKVVSMYVHFIIICVGTATFVLERDGPDCYRPLYVEMNIIFHYDHSIMSSQHDL